MSTEENVPAVVQNSKAAQAYMAQMLPSLAALSQRKYDKASWAQTVVLAIVENPALTKCLNTTEGKSSLYHALKFAAATGLSMNPQEGKCAFIPYGNKIQYQVMKNGMVDVALSDPNVRNIRSLVVREHDIFKIKQTLDGDTFEFEPHNTDRGEVIGFFAAIKMEKGPSYVKYMTKEEVEKHRDKYSKAAKIGAWKDSFDGMGEKTVIKSMLRTTNISTDLDILVGIDDKAEAEIIDVTPAPSLEDSVQVVEEVQEGVTVDVTPESAEPAIPASGFGELDPPVSKGDIVIEDVRRIFAKLNAIGIKDEQDQHAEVSKILCFNAVVQSMNYLNAIQGELVIDQLKEREKELKGDK